MNLVQSVAIRGLRSAGYRVFPPPKPPPLGTVWHPRDPAIPAREVLGAGPANVIYRADGREAAVSLAGWHRWRQRTRAVAWEQAA